MGEMEHYKTGNLQLDANDYQKCFVGYSVDTPWSSDLVQACNEVLPDFDMQAEYATNEFDPTATLREKVANLIAGTRYGIYDLSYWRRNEQGDWIMPRNVLIELGIAIALNRPTLLLRHTGNRIAGAPIPSCLESISPDILEFSGYPTLKKVLSKHIPQWKAAATTPKNDLWNRYCTFGDRVCEYREAHPHMQRWRQKILRCHISDGNDPNRTDFRLGIEEVLRLFDNIQFNYLDGLPLAEGYRFLLCTCCQAVRTTPFAIYRITPYTPAETFIAIGLSLALEMQYTHAIPKVLLTPNLQYIPSLLSGYEVVVEKNDQQRLISLRKSMPSIIQRARKTVWKSRPLAFVEIMPKSLESLNATSTSDEREISPITAEASGSRNPTPRKRISANQVTGVLKQAQTFQSQGRFNDAIDLCEQVLESGFDRPDARYFLGWLYQEQQRWDDAIRQFQLLSNDPDYALSCYYAVGQCYRARGDLRSAVVHFDEAVDRVNLDALTMEESDQLIQLCQEAAEAHRMLGEQEQALTVYNALLGFLRSRGWSDKVAEVEHMLQQVQNASAPSQPVLPPPDAARPLLSPSQGSAQQSATASSTPPGELPDWLAGLLNESDRTQDLPSPVVPQPIVQKQARLIVLSTKQSFPLAREVIVVGRRDPTLGVYPDINLADKTVGRRHAYIRKQDDYFTVEDLNTLNKTHLNGVTLTPHEERKLKNGDILRFASVEARFERN